MNKNRMSYGQAAGVAMVVSLAFAGCATSNDSGGGPSSAAKTAGLGTLAGAGLGAIIGHQSGHTGEGAAIGAGAGALGGYILGNEKDKAQTQSQLNATQAQANQALTNSNEVFVNMTNSNGSITTVKLIREGNMYVGPKGERYPSVPSEKQLREGGYGL